jgi:DNA-binding transcriptional ArsR family regulator
LEKDLDDEVEQYWIKELPVRTTISQYMKNVGMLITIYHQQESILKKTFDEITEGVEYPDWEALEESYKNEIDSMETQMVNMKKQVEKFKVDLQEEFDEAVAEEAQKERVKLHREYEELMTEAELKIETLETEISKMREQLVRLSSLGAKKGDSEIVDKKKKTEKSAEKSESVYIGAKSPHMKGVEIHEPETSRESKEKIDEKPKKDDKSKYISNPVLRDEVRDEILSRLGKGQPYNQIRKEMSKKYSVSTFYKYLNELKDDGIIHSEAEGEFTIQYKDDRIYKRKRKNDKKDN